MTIDRLDLQAVVVRLDPGTANNNEGRSFYVTAELRKALQTRLESNEVLEVQGTICPYVFHRSDGSRIKDFRETWKKA